MKEQYKVCVLVIERHWYQVEAKDEEDAMTNYLDGEVIHTHPVQDEPEEAWKVEDE